MHTALAGAMRTVGREMAAHVRRDVQARFHVHRPAFLRSVRAKVFDQKLNQLPALYIGSKIPWLGIHAQGGSIQGRMLIPLLPAHQRIGRRAFARVITALLQSGHAFFVHKTGHAVLMAQITPENRSLARFKRAERARTGAKRLKRAARPFPSPCWAGACPCASALIWSTPCAVICRHWRKPCRLRCSSFELR